MNKIIFHNINHDTSFYIEEGDSVYFESHVYEEDPYFRIDMKGGYGLWFELHQNESFKKFIQSNEGWVLNFGSGDKEINFEKTKLGINTDQEGIIIYEDDVKFKIYLK